MVLLEAIAGLAEKDRIELEIVGDGPRRAELEEYARRNSLARIVKFIGSAGDTENCFARADVAIFPSLFGEGLLGSVLEAMASSCLVIATKNNGNDDILSHGRGVLVEPGSVAEIREGLREALCSKEGTRKMGEASRKYIEDNFSWSKSFKNFIKETQE